jgi:hypothetical protein
MELMSVFSLKSFSGGVADLTAYQLDTPTIGDVSDDEVYERDYIEVTIDNYDKEAEYEANSELITKIRYKSDNVVKVYFGSVDEDTNLDFKIRSLKVGYLVSEWSDTISIKVKDRPEESDDAIINDAFEDNLDDSDSADVTNDKVTITADGGYYKENVTEQGDDEEDWSSYQSYCEIELKKMNILDDDTTKDELVVTDDITEINKCYITNDDYPDGLLIDVGDVEKEGGDDGSGVGVLDILDDDSCIDCFMFDDDLTSLGDNDGVIDGTEQYDDGQFDKCLSLDGSSAVKVDGANKPDFPFSVSLWVKDNDSDDGAVIYDFAGAKLTHYTGDNGLKIWDKSKVSATSGEHISNDDFIHIVVIHTGDDNKELYINKNEIDLSDGDDANNYEYNHLLIGARGDGDSVKDGYFKGYIDQVRIFNGALSKDEIDKTYKEQYTKYKADISSNELENPPKTAYFEESSFTLSTALTKDTNPTDDDFVDEEMDSFKIDTDTDIKEVTFKKVSDYSGNKFQRKFTGDEEANVTYIKSNMWKDS